MDYLFRFDDGLVVVLCYVVSARLDNTQGRHSVYITTKTEPSGLVARNSSPEEYEKFVAALAKYFSD